MPKAISENPEGAEKAAVLPTLCIIGGMPRGGTRNFTDLANAHPNVSLFGEVQPNALPTVDNTLSALEAVHSEGLLRGYERFLRRKHHIALSLVALCSKNPKPHLKDSNYDSGVVGFKTPGIEKEFEILDRVFNGFMDRRIFFYCCRSIDQNYLSLKEFGWRRDVYHYIKHLRASLNNAMNIYRKSQKDSDWTFRPLHLDDYILADDKSSWLFQNFFSYLPVETTLRDVEGFIGSTENRNSTLNKLGRKRSTELTQEERDIFERDKELRALIDTVNEAWGVSIEIL